MGFSNQERINMNSAALAAGVIDANSSAVWYEKFFPFSFQLNADTVLLELSSIPAASTISQAQTNAASIPTILQDLSAAADAVRITKVSGTNSSTFAAYSVYNDASSALLKNWLLPQLVPQASGAPSKYGIRLYNGDPNSGGTEITTTIAETGTGTTKSVGWVFNYALGLLLLSDDFYTLSGISSASFDPYIIGFRYIGKTSLTAATSTERNEFAATADETLAIGDAVRFVESFDSGLTAGRVIKASATNENSSGVIGVATSTGNQGDSVNVATSGKVTINFGSAQAASNNGKPIFLSTSSGQVTTTPPSGSGQVVVPMGRIFQANGSLSIVGSMLNIGDPTILG
jgi:hypothetical protein